MGYWFTFLANVFVNIGDLLLFVDYYIDSCMMRYDAKQKMAPVTFVHNF